MYLKVSEGRTDAFIFFQLIDFLGKVAWRLQGDKESKSCTNLDILWFWNQSSFVFVFAVFLWETKLALYFSNDGYIWHCFWNCSMRKEQNWHYIWAMMDIYDIVLEIYFIPTNHKV